MKVLFDRILLGRICGYKIYQDEDTVGAHLHNVPQDEFPLDMTQSGRARLWAKYGLYNRK